MAESNNYRTIQTKDTDIIYEKKITFDEILDKVGYTKFHFTIIVIAGFTLFISGLEIYQIYLLGPVLKEAYGVGDSFISAIVTSLLIGLCIGSLFSGLLVKKFERRKPFLVFFVIISIFGTICIFINNEYWFMFCRFVIGISIGVLFNITNTLFEVLPTKFRDFIMGSVFIYFKIGVVYWILVYLIISGFYDPVDSYKLIIIVSNIPTYIVTIMAFLYLRESPRLLLWNNKQEETFETLNEIAEGSSYTILEEEKVQLVNTVREQKRLQTQPDSFIAFIRPLFENSLIKITMLSSALWLLNNLIIVGNTYALPLILKMLEKGSNITTASRLELATHEFLLKMLVSSLIPIPGDLLAGYMTSVPLFGRIYTILIGFVFQFIFALLMVIDLNRVFIYSSFITFFNIFSSNIIKLYTTEVYSTHLRDSGTGFSNFVSRIGAIVIPYLIELSLKASLIGPGLLLTFFSLCGIVLTLLLPYDTFGKKPDEEKDK
jgi:MFS family permease